MSKGAFLFFLKHSFKAFANQKIKHNMTLITTIINMTNFKNNYCHFDPCSNIFATLFWIFSTCFETTTYRLRSVLVFRHFRVMDSSISIRCYRKFCSTHNEIDFSLNRGHSNTSDTLFMCHFNYLNYNFIAFESSKSCLKANLCLSKH